MSAKEQGRENVGKIVEIKGVVVDAVFPERLPGITNALRIAMTDADGGARDLIGEVQQHLGGGRVRAVALDSTDGLARGADAVDTGAPISVPVGKETLGRVFNLLGEPIDKSEPGGGAERWPIHREPPDFADLSPKPEVFETGIKVIDLLGAVRPRRQDRPLRRRGRWARRSSSRSSSPTSPRSTAASPSSPASASARARATTSGSKCRSRASSTSVALVFGQMNEPPGARLRVGLSGLTMAEYFRDAGPGRLLFIDNIFRFIQAGSEVSALLGRMPSAVGYQPTLATEMGELQERITSTATGAITSVQAVYVPADDLTDPAPANTFAHLDAFIVLSRPISEKGIYPADRPARVASRAPSSPASSRDDHYEIAARVQRDPPALQGPPGHHRHPRHGRALRRGQAHRHAGAEDRALPLAAVLRRRGVHRRPGVYVKLEDTVKGFREIVEGKHDELPEQAFYMVGTIEEAVQAAQGSVTVPEAAEEPEQAEETEEAEAEPVAAG